MANFTDSQGREWSINLNVGLASRLKKRFGIDFVAALYDVEKSLSVIGELYQQLDRFCEVVYILASVDIPLDEFMDAMEGNQIADAFEALDQTFTDFHPPGKRERIARTKAAMKAALENGQESMMGEINQKVEAEIKQAIRAAAGLPSIPGK